MVYLTNICQLRILAKSWERCTCTNGLPLDRFLKECLIRMWHKPNELQMFWRVWSCRVNKTHLYRVLIWPISVCHILSASLSHRTWLTHWPTHDRAFSGSWSQQAPCTMHVYWTYREDGRSSKSALLPVIQHTFTILHMPIRRASVTKCRYFQRF